MCFILKKLHTDFSDNHPFIDGYGRTSRLLTNLELMNADNSPCDITVENLLADYTALDQ